MSSSDIPRDYNTYAASIAPAAIGAALGLLFGREMDKRSSNLAALALLATGAVVAAPAIVDLIQRAANRPSTARGSERRLRTIRDAGLPDADAEGFFIDDEALAVR
jgi:uncharacterized membrane protein YebE (DUF533 family)